MRYSVLYFLVSLFFLAYPINFPSASLFTSGYLNNHSAKIKLPTLYFSNLVATRHFKPTLYFLKFLIFLSPHLRYSCPNSSRRLPCNFLHIATLAHPTPSVSDFEFSTPAYPVLFSTASKQAFCDSVCLTSRYILKEPPALGPVSRPRPKRWEI